MTKLDNEWRYKIEEICEEYENKIELMEREKEYQINSAEETAFQVKRLEHDKAGLRLEHEREKESWEDKLTRMEEEKLIHLKEKNKEI